MTQILQNAPAREKVYGELEFDKANGVWIISNLAPHVAIRLKQLFPGLSKSSRGPFAIPGSRLASADLEWFESRYLLAMSEECRTMLHASAKDFFNDQAEANRILLPTFTPQARIGLVEGQAFRHYQSQGLALLEHVRGMVFVDDIGLGKTYEGLGVGLIPGALPLIIVVEPHLQNQWVTKAAEFINLRVHAPKGNTPYSLPDADIYIFKYNQLSPWIDVITQGWVKAVVFDEIQQLRTGTDSAKGEAAKALCDSLDAESGIRTGLTATPIFNYGVEAYNIVEFIRPGFLGSREDFLREWCETGTASNKGVVTDPAALGAYLQESHVFLRRTKADVGQQAKQKAPEIKWVPVDEDAVGDSTKLAEELAIKTLSGDFHEAGHAAQQLDLALRQATGIAKAKAAATYIRMYAEAGTPVLVAGWHREVYRIWQKELADLNPLMYTGSESPAQKERAKKAFLNGESRILFMSLRSGAGTDGLHKVCSTAIIGELDWSPRVHTQFIGRLDRDDQSEAVHALYIATEFGSDLAMMDLLGLKDSQGRGISDPHLGAETKQADPDRIKEMARRFLASRNIPIPKKKRIVSEEEQLALL